MPQFYGAQHPGGTHPPPGWSRLHKTICHPLTWSLRQIQREPPICSALNISMLAHIQLEWDDFLSDFFFFPCSVNSGCFARQIYIFLKYVSSLRTANQAACSRLQPCHLKIASENCRLLLARPQKPACTLHPPSSLHPPGFPRAQHRSKSTQPVIAHPKDILQYFQWGSRVGNSS